MMITHHVVVNEVNEVDYLLSKLTICCRSVISAVFVDTILEQYMTLILFISNFINF